MSDDRHQHQFQCTFSASPDVSTVGTKTSWLDTTLNEALKAAAVASAGEHRHHQTVQSLQTNVLLKVLAWTGLRWSQLRDMANQCIYVHPDIAQRLTMLIHPQDESAVRVIQQHRLVRPDKLARALNGIVSSPTNCSSSSQRDESFCLSGGGTSADELDAILAVDGLAAQPLPDFDVKRYLDNCRFPVDDAARDSTFEWNTTEDDDRRVHVSAVRRMYAKVPVRVLRQQHLQSSDEGCDDGARTAHQVVYAAMCVIYKRFGVELPSTGCSSRVDDEVTRNLVPTLVDTYVGIVGNERLRRMVGQMPEPKKQEKRGRKRKNHGGKDEASSKKTKDVSLVDTKTENAEESSAVDTSSSAGTTAAPRAV